MILFVAMGVLDLGRAMYAYVAVSSAAQAGAEYAARNATYNASGVTDAVLNEGGAFLQSQSGSIVVVANEENGSQVRVVRVTVRYEFTPIIPVLFSATMPIQVTAAAPM
jgi:Flp pilus assembly protein TadG